MDLPSLLQSQKADLARPVSSYGESAADVTLVAWKHIKEKHPKSFLKKNTLYIHPQIFSEPGAALELNTFVSFLVHSPYLPDTENAERGSSHPMASVMTANETGLIKCSGPLPIGRVQWPWVAWVSFTESSVAVSGVSGLAWSENSLESLAWKEMLTVS